MIKRFTFPHIAPFHENENWCGVKIIDAIHRNRKYELFKDKICTSSR